MNEYPWAVGQSVVIAYERRRKDSLAHDTITKIGRRWITLNRNEGRFDAATGYLDGAGYASPWRVYIDRKTYEEEKEVSDLWGRFYREVTHMGWNKPLGMTAGNIRAAAALLGIELNLVQP